MTLLPKRPVQTVTRETLYEQVWARPVRTVAVDYGISDVALAKICKKLDVPRPGVGYWSRLQHGQRPLRPELPTRRRGVPVEAEICGVASAAPPPPPGSRPVFPMVPAPETLLHPHPTVRRIRAELDKQDVHKGALALPAKRETVLRVTPAGRARALIILDALAKGLATRGHELVFGMRHVVRSTIYSLAAYVGEQAVDVALYEPTRQIPHVRTKSELAAEARGRYVFIPDYDYPPTGTFRLTIGGPAPEQHAEALDVDAHGAWTDSSFGALAPDGETSTRRRSRPFHTKRVTPSSSNLDRSDEKHRCTFASSTFALRSGRQPRGLGRRRARAGG